MAFDLSINSVDVLEVSVIGDLDINNVDLFRNSVIERFDEENKDVVLDFKALDYIDSTGLGAIIAIYKEVKEAGKTIKVINAKRNIKKLFVITELDSLFEIGDQNG